MTHVSGRISLCYCTYFLSVSVCLCVCVCMCVLFSPVFVFFCFYFAFMGYVPELKVIDKEQTMSR